MSRPSPTPLLRLYGLGLRELLRNRLGLVLLALIPPLFMLTVEWTSGHGALPIDLPGADVPATHLLSQHDVNVVFVAAAVSGFLTAYFAILLFQGGLDYYKHCMGMGLGCGEYAAARMLFFLTVVVVLAAYTTLLAALLVPLHNPVAAFLGFTLLGLIYGGYGGLVALLVRDFLGAVLAIALLANLDAGWLQNPVFAGSAESTALARWLPAFHPTQVVFDAAFPGGWGLRSLLQAAGYAALFWLALVFVLRTQVRSICRWWEVPA